MMKKNLNHSWVRLWAFVLAFALLLPGCGTGAGTTQGGGESQEPAGQSPEETPEPAMQGTEEEWRPTAPVNLIIPFAAGSGTDNVGRAVAKYIDLDGQSMYITNIEGGSGTIGAMEGYHADNDGLTLLMLPPISAASAYVTGTLSENLCEEMTWVATLAQESYVVCVAPDSPYESLEDVITAAKADPGSFPLAGSGSPSWRAAALMLQHSTGVEFNIVPYDSASKARTAVMGGHEELLLCTLADMKPYADSGELRILAIELEERSELVPSAPTFKELGYDFTVGSSRTISLPPETDEEIARYYEAKLKEVAENEEFRSVMGDTLGLNVVFMGKDNLVDQAKEALEWAKANMSPAVE